MIPFTKNKSLTIAMIVLCLALLSSCSQPPSTPLEDTPPHPDPTLLPDKDELPLYKDPTASLEDRVEDLLARMTLEEKIGQMTQVENLSIDKDDITDLFIGSILSGSDGHPSTNNPESWAKMVNAYQERALKTRLSIPLIYGVDAIHGHNGVKGAVIFPQSIGLGASRDPDLVRRIGRITAEEMVATGIYWNFAPIVAVPQDIRWGRTYESYSEDTDLVSLLSRAFIEGLQGDDLNDPLTVLATPKHFVGDGGTTWGTSKMFIGQQFMLDQGDTRVDEATLRRIHLPPYIDALDAGVLSIMVSFSSWNGEKMHGHKYLLTDVLKNELGFEGFLVSDWGGIDQIADRYDDAVVMAINAGVDMNMVPYDYDRFIQTLTSAVEKGDVSEERIDDAVRRILRVKFKLGLFERPFANEALLTNVGSEEHRSLASQAVAKTLVLLKNNEDTLPLPKDTAMIFVGGKAANDIGIQCGGWTLQWQGRTGNIMEGTTILEGIKNTVDPATRVEFNRFGRFERILDEDGHQAIAEIGIVVVGEFPYQEGVGDRADLHLSDADIGLIERMRERSKKLVIILISGRPMIITEQLPLADAFVAAWLPGTEGQGLSDVLFGDLPFTGKLPFSWPRRMDQLPFDFSNLGTGEEGPLFPYGYGLEMPTNPQ